MSKLLETHPGPEGMEARIFDTGPQPGVKCPLRYTVTLVDTDAGETLPTMRRFYSLDGAQAYARSLVRS